MKIALVSDIHLEFSSVTIPNNENAEVLILAGDVLVSNDLDRNLDKVDNPGPRQEDALRYIKFFDQVCSDFPHVIYVAGNHEFYNGYWEKTLTILRDFSARWKNLHFLENDVVKIQDVNFIGATLWTNMNKGDPMTLHAVGDMMNDFRIVRNDNHGYTRLRPAQTIPRHSYSLGYFKTVVSERKDEKFVAVSHHAPSFQSVNERYRSEFIMNGAYASDLSEFILDHPNIKYWVHGHMHDPVRYNVGETTVVCHPRGYVSKNSDPMLFKFDPVTFEC